MTSINFYPQPIGIFPSPVGYLVLPPARGSKTAHESLLRGVLPDVFPQAWTFYAHALQGKFEAALTSLKDDRSAIARYNGFVLQPSRELYSRLSYDLYGELRGLLDVLAFTKGYLDEPPAANGTTNEIRAFKLLTRANHALAINHFKVAVNLLTEAIYEAYTTSPVFAGQLMSKLATVERRLNGVNAVILQRYQTAIHLMAETSLRDVLSNTWLNLGTAYHEVANDQPNMLIEAINCYQQAATLLNRNVHAKQWVKIQHCLADALTHLPPSRNMENLIRAVEIYEDLLTFYAPELNAIGYAQILMKQGRALVQIGIFEEAITKLIEAQQLLEDAGDMETALAVETAISHANIAQSRKVNS